MGFFAIARRFLHRLFRGHRALKRSASPAETHGDAETNQNRRGTQENVLPATPEISTPQALGPLQSISEDIKSTVDHTEKSHLCSRCLTINFDKIFRNATSDSYILFFNTTDKLIRDSECVFCQAMHFAYPSWDTQPSPKKRKLSLIAVTSRDRTYLTFVNQNHHPTRGVTLWTKEKVERRNEEDCTDRDFVGSIAEMRTMEQSEQALPAACIKPHVNFDMINKLLEECRTEHHSCKGKHYRCMDQVVGLRLIDCESQTVVPAPKEDFSYAALSYVWGMSEHFPKDRYNGLPTELSNTIADAMLVTQKLKMRYLWCDRYCIIQDPQSKEDMNHKAAQIAQMHHIYGRASITIIAAAGDGPQYGLPGVVKKRQPPPCVRIGSLTLSTTLPDPKLLMDRSKWSTRGWTFQEGLLARRRLVFTDQQVYFQCGEIGHAEAWEECRVEPMFKFDRYRNTPVHPYFSMGEGGYPRIWPRIHDYANLTLMHPEDILNAIRGVLACYEEVSETEEKIVQVRYIAGLPIKREATDQRSWSSALSLALAWECDKPGKRRKGFPSWSWIGWHCRGFKRNENIPEGMPENRIRELGLSVQGHNNELSDQHELESLIETRHDFSEAVFLHISAPSLEARITRRHERVTTSDPDRMARAWGWYYPSENRPFFYVEYLDHQRQYEVNISDGRLLNSPIPSEGLKCYSIIVDEERPDGRDEQLGNNGDEEPFAVRKDFATTLIVVEKHDGFERIGVSTVDRKDLRRAGSEIRNFKLM